MEQNNNPDKQLSLSKVFLAVVVCLLCLFAGYICGQTISFRNSEKYICKEYERHITVIDSLYTSHIEMAASLCPDTLAFKSYLRNQLYADSTTLAKERNLAIESQKALIYLHIEKVDNDYTVITIWGAVLSILFIVFSFFSIYKIEDTKKQMEELRVATDKEAKEQLSAIKKAVDNHNKDASTKAKMIKEMIEKYNNGYANFEKSWNETFVNLQNRYQDAINLLASATDKFTHK